MSALDKLDGAERQLSLLRKVSEEGAVTDLLEFRTDRDHEGRVRVRVEEMGEIPPEWFVWIGECIYNMRSALDHLAYALNVVGSRCNPPPNEKSSQFPLFPQRATFRAMARRSQSKCMVGYFPRGSRTRVERLQPYHRRRDDDAWRLGELNACAMSTSHRRVPVTAVTSSITTLPRDPEADGQPITRIETFYRRLKPGRTIMRFEVPTLPSSVKEPTVDFGYGAEIEFEGKSGKSPIPLVMPYEPVWFVLRSIHTAIRSRVVPDFEEFFA